MRLFYYNQLNVYERVLYLKIERAIANFVPEIEIEDLRISLKRVEEIGRMVAIDCPEYYWSKGSFDSFETPKGITLIFSYLLRLKDRDDLDFLIFQRIAQMEIKDSMSTEEKVNAVHDWIKHNVKYDMDKNSIDRCEDQTIYSVFIQGRSLCMGIAKAFDLVISLCDIDGFVALGSVFGDKKAGHAWNMVLHNGNYLQVDVTVGYPEFKPLWRKYHGNRYNRCVLLPFEYITASHALNRRFKYPVMGDHDFGCEEVW